MHSCALTSTGAVKCWGSDQFGQLGDGGSNSSKFDPVDVSGLSSGVVAIAAGKSHTCALTSAGAVKCWGRNKFGQLGNSAGFGFGVNPNSGIPSQVTGLSSGVVALAAGGYHSCALTTAGSVLCWGSDHFGQLGNEGSISSSPVAVSGLSSGVIAIATGENHTCAVTNAGAVKCWGMNAFGQLGIGGSSPAAQVTPVDVSGLSSGVMAIAAGAYHSCALTTAGAVLCWGRNASGQLGNSGGGSSIGAFLDGSPQFMAGPAPLGAGTLSRTPVPVSGLSSGVMAITAGFAYTCARTTAGAALCWGSDSVGQLGNGGSNSDQFVPAAVVGLSSGVIAIASGGAHTCAITNAGTALCWGNDASGQLGNGVLVGSNQPIPVVVGGGF